MTKCECIYKYRNNSGKIVKYIVINDAGTMIEFKPDDLKKDIIGGTINVTNLALTSDGRLIDREHKRNDKITSLIEKTVDKHRDMFDGIRADIKIKAWDMLNEMGNRKGNRAYVDFTNEIAKHIGKGSISFK